MKESGGKGGGMTRIRRWWWGMPDTQRVALILGPLAVVGALLLQDALGI